MPVFVAHGREDSVVSIEQSGRQAAELKDRGLPHVARFEGGEGHGMSFVKNRVELHTAIEEILALNL